MVCRSPCLLASSPNDCSFPNQRRRSPSMLTTWRPHNTQTMQITRHTESKSIPSTGLSYQPPSKALPDSHLCYKLKKSSKRRKPTRTSHLEPRSLHPHASWWLDSETHVAVTIITTGRETTWAVTALKYTFSVHLVLKVVLFVARFSSTRGTPFEWLSSMYVNFELRSSNLRIQRWVKISTTFVAYKRQYRPRLLERTSKQ
jgi:hypothetical protein